VKINDKLWEIKTKRLDAFAAPRLFNFLILLLYFDGAQEETRTLTPCGART
jgi:hypothetical protein